MCKQSAYPFSQTCRYGITRTKFCNFIPNTSLNFFHITDIVTGSISHKSIQHVNSRHRSLAEYFYDSCIIVYFFCWGYILLLFNKARTFGEKNSPGHLLRNQFHWSLVSRWNCLGKYRKPQSKCKSSKNTLCR